MDYIERMKEELKELNEKIRKLEKWDKKDDLMMRQLDVMKEYAHILKKRLKQVKK